MWLHKTPSNFNFSLRKIRRQYCPSGKSGEVESDSHILTRFKRGVLKDATLISSLQGYLNILSGPDWDSSPIWVFRTGYSGLRERSEGGENSFFNQILRSIFRRVIGASGSTWQVVEVSREIRKIRSSVKTGSIGLEEAWRFRLRIIFLGGKDIFKRPKRSRVSSFVLRIWSGNLEFFSRILTFLREVHLKCFLKVT